MAGEVVYPLVVEAVFNEFEPLRMGELRTRTLRLADVEDVPVDEVLVADASHRTTSLNAYVVRNDELVAWSSTTRSPSRCRWSRR